MFVIELVYKAPLAEIDAAMAAHVGFLKKYYASGTSSSRAGRSRATAASSSPPDRAASEIEAIVREDPFVARGLADFRVIEFRASQRAKALEHLRI